MGRRVDEETLRTVRSSHGGQRTGAHGRQVNLRKGEAPTVSQGTAIVVGRRCIDTRIELLLLLLLLQKKQLLLL